MPISPSFRYQPYYCEENVFHLCQDARFAGRDPAAVFVSGLGGACVMWHQQLASCHTSSISWDYHVFLLAREPWEVWDFDTVLGLPVPAAKYLRESFRPEIPLADEYVPHFRVVRAPALAAVFASDRSHMRDPDGHFYKAPPSWSPIGPAGAPSNLARFTAMTDPIAGEVLGLPALLARIAMS